MDSLSFENVTSRTILANAVPKLPVGHGLPACTRYATVTSTRRVSPVHRAWDWIGAPRRRPSKDAASMQENADDLVRIFIEVF